MSKTEYRAKFLLSGSQINKKRKDITARISEEILAKDLMVKFNYIDQQYAKDAPKLVSEVMQDMSSKTIVPFDLSALYKNIRWVYAHSINVALLSAIFAAKLGINKANTRKIVIAALLHDIGKTIIPAVIVNKTEGLSPEETTLLKQHPELGAEILANLGFEEGIQLIVKQHHELLNGEGYPQGITKGLHIYTQIIGVSNKFDSMLSDTHFKKASSLIEALEEMEQKKGSEYDAAIIDVLFQVFERKRMNPEIPS